MKFSVTFKDPDGPFECIQDAAKEWAATLEGLDDDEREQMSEARQRKLSEFAGKWLDYGEYVTIEFDTDANTATIVPTK